MNIRLVNDLYNLMSECFAFPLGEDNPKNSTSPLTKNSFLDFLIGAWSDSGIMIYTDYPNKRKQILNEQSEIGLIDIFHENYHTIYNINPPLRKLIGRESHINPRQANARNNFLNSRRKEIETLYKKYVPASGQPLSSLANIDQLLETLFKLCITEKRFFSFDHFISASKLTNRIVGRDNDFLLLKEQLTINDKIIISGAPGSGKTLFILSFLSKNHIKDHCYLSYNANLTEMFSGIKFFSPEYTDIYCSIKDANMPKPILVIDNVEKSKSLPKDMQELSKLHISVIVISNTAISNEAFSQFKLSELTEQNIIDIFSSASSGQPVGDIPHDLFFGIVGRHPGAASLLGYCYEKLSAKAENLTEILNELNKGQRYLSDDSLLSLKFKHPYDSAYLNILSHLKQLYEKYFISSDENMHKYMQYISCFGTSVLPVKFVEEIIPCHTEEYINRLSEAGLIIRTADNIYLSGFISRAALSKEKPTAKNIKPMTTLLIRFLREFTDDLSVPYIGDALISYATSMNDYVFLKHNPQQLNASEEYETWQTFLYLSFNYYYQLGNTTHAESLLNILSYPENDIIYENNLLDKFAFQLLIDFLRTKNRVAFAEGIQSLQDKINAQCPKDECNQNLSEIFKLPTFLTIYLAQDTIDTIITNIHSEIVLHLRNHLHRELSFVSYQKCLEFLEKDLHQHLYSHKEADKYDIYKTDYYALSLVITFEKELSDDEFKRYVETTDQYENLNQRICLYAQLLNKAAVITYYSDKQIGRNGYLDLLTPVLIKLNASIACCDLIPRHTFLLCFFAYINAACCSYTLTKHKVLNPTDCSTSFRGQLSDLLKKCPFVLPEDKDRCALLLEKNHNYLL